LTGFTKGRFEQVRLLRLFAELFESRAAANPTKPDDLSITLLTDALPNSESLAMFSDHYKGKSMLTNELASQEARWQLKLERKERDFARLQELGQKNLKAFRLVRRWACRCLLQLSPKINAWRFPLDLDF